MLKKHASVKNKSILILLQQIFAISLVVILLTLMTSICVKSSSGNRMIYIDLLESEDNFQESGTFKQLFSEDINMLVYYLAICQQFESDGAFDKNKTVDLLQYANRKELKANEITSDGALVYPVGDLINWHEVDGLETKSIDDINDNDYYAGELYNIVEKYLPVDGVSLSDKDLYQILLNAGIIDENCIEQTQRQSFDYESYATSLNEVEADVYSVNIETAEELYDADVENVEEDVLYIEKQDYTDEEFTDIKREILHFDERAQTIVADYIMSAAGDLAVNYRTYIENKDYFEQNKSIKYLYIPEKSKKGIYTNCAGKSVDKLRTAFEKGMEAGTGSYIKYDLSEDEITAKNYNSNDKNHTNIRKMLHEYEYAYTGKGTLYVAYINSDAEANLFDGCNYANDGIYAQAEKVHDSVRPNFIGYMIAMGCLAFGLLVCFILWSGMIGYSQQIIEEDGQKKKTYQCVTKEELHGFDRVYTSVAAVIAIGVETLIAGLMIALALDGYMDNEIEILSSDGLIGISIVMTVFLVTGFQFFWASFIRRCRAHTLWSNGIIVHTLHFLKRVKNYIAKNIIGKFMLTFADANIIVKMWIPYFLFLLINLILILFGFAIGSEVVCILVALAFDIVIGVFMEKCARERKIILDGIGRIADGEITYQLDTDNMHGENVLFAKAVNRIGDGIHEAVEISMKDERLKADLITNVSHDIKTPLTSIINYVDLLKRIDIQDEKAKEYLDVLDEKSQRLKQLTLDLVEASKISSGNIILNFEHIKVKDLMMQVIGEFADKFNDSNLTIVANFPEEVVQINADSRRMWRVMENLFQNICKYAMPGTRVYLDVIDKGKIWIVIKNISAQELNINADELTERFIRGDVSRSTEGSGLGLSIAKNLVEAQNGTFQIVLDGDLFKINMSFEKEE